MIVHVRLHTILRKKTPEGIVDRLDLELGSEATVDTVLSRMDIPITGRSVLLVLNGKLVDRTARLADGDELRLVPAISGGALGLQARRYLARCCCPFTQNRVLEASLTPLVTPLPDHPPGNRHD